MISGIALPCFTICRAGAVRSAITAINLQFKEQSSLLTLSVLLDLLTHVDADFTHQLALLWGTRHLISPELARKDELNFFVFFSSCS